MQTIQIVLDEQLLRATDDAATRTGRNRSALIREALRLYLKRLRIGDLERDDRAGYQREPDAGGDLALWEGAAAWPDD